MNTTNCCKCHKRTEINEESQPDGVYCDECWEDQQTFMDHNDPEFYDYMDYSDADSGL